LQLFENPLIFMRRECVNLHEDYIESVEEVRAAHTRKYRWTSALLDELRRAYLQTGAARADLVSALAGKTGWPRHVLQQRALKSRKFQ
jgi:hypothetical protein